MRSLTVLSIAVVFSLLWSYTNEARPHSKLHGKYWSLLLSELGEAQYSSGVSSKNRIEHIPDQITQMRDDVRDWGSNAIIDQNTYRKNIISQNKPGKCRLSGGDHLRKK